MAFYGRSFILANASQNEPGSPSSGPGLAGPITNKPGLLAFNEVNKQILNQKYHKLNYFPTQLCDMYLHQPNISLKEDEYHLTSHIKFDRNWISIDDELAIYLKTKYSFSNNLQGVFLWALNYDDFQNKCGWGHFPLLKAINKAVEHCNLVQNQC